MSERQASRLLGSVSMVAAKRLVYVLKNAEPTSQFYVGLTFDVLARVDDHNAGRCPHRATSYEPNVVEGRFMIHVRHLQRPWIAIVEPDADEKLLIVVTVYEVSE